MHAEAVTPPYRKKQDLPSVGTLLHNIYLLHTPENQEQITHWSIMASLQPLPKSGKTVSYILVTNDPAVVNIQKYEDFNTKMT